MGASAGQGVWGVGQTWSCSVGISQLARAMAAKDVLLGLFQGHDVTANCVLERHPGWTGILDSSIHRCFFSSDPLSLCTLKLHTENFNNFPSSQRVSFHEQDATGQRITRVNTKAARSEF